jgi:hypothetical protein
VKPTRALVRRRLQAVARGCGGPARQAPGGRGDGGTSRRGRVGRSGEPPRPPQGEKGEVSVVACEKTWVRRSGAAAKPSPASTYAVISA